MEENNEEMSIFPKSNIRYKDNCGIVYCSDTIKLMKQTPSESVDLIIVDPPYNSKAIDWDNKNDEWQYQWLNESKRILKPGGSFYCFFAPMNMFYIEAWFRTELTLKNLIVWYHPNLYGAGMSYGKDRYKSTWDVVFYAVKGKKAKHGKNVSSTAYRETGRGFDVMKYSQPRPLIHKGEKPLALIEKFIICSSNEGDVVLDPFVGSGTTAIACKRLNRKFIVNDIEPKFLDNLVIDRLKVCKNLDELKSLDKSIWRKLKGKE